MTLCFSDLPFSVIYTSFFSSSLLSLFILVQRCYLGTQGCCKHFCQPFSGLPAEFTQTEVLLTDSWLKQSLNLWFSPDSFKWRWFHRPFLFLLDHVVIFHTLYTISRPSPRLSLPQHPSPCSIQHILVHSVTLVYGECINKLRILFTNRTLFIFSFKPLRKIYNKKLSLDYIGLAVLKL